ncbi:MULTISPECIES: sigma factor G inhibitor Gin [Alkalibacillus]|uniref:Methyltransferase n=2 Tax=Alkalibacillus TaxID=331654 RepID=A0ABT9VBS1_9BACI|nr:MULTISPECIES: sigma factor G inhibitor Gin [Alkalibacillus]MDQ0158425.1 putative methyltransferase [Alkalibacillus salilacus]NIK12732.1 putative methyltransferase [Alkalibacillus almallahensis]
MNQMTFHYCQVCDQWKAQGIYVLTNFICQSCERAIVQTNPEEEQYQYYVEKMKSRPLTNQMLM